MTLLWFVLRKDRVSTLSFLILLTAVRCYFVVTFNTKLDKHMAISSLRLSDELQHEVDVCADEMHISRAAYVRKALEQMNAAVHAQRRWTRLMEVSLRVRDESIRVNAQFDAIEEAPKRNHGEVWPRIPA